MRTLANCNSSARVASPQSLLPLSFRGRALGGGGKLKILSSGTFQYSYPAMTFEMSLRRVKRHKLKNKLTVKNNKNYLTKN
jgi:hypothetical protein